MRDAIVYTASTREEIGCLRALALFVRDVRVHWPQIATGMASDWAGIYRGSYLGVAWAVILAVVPMSVFIVLAMLGVFPSEGEMPRSVYISAGITIWMVIAETITTSINKIRFTARSLSGSQDPLAVALVSQYGLLLSDSLIRFTALLAWMLASGMTLHWTLLLFPLAILPVLLFAMGLGLILGAFNVAVPDVNPLTGMALRYAVFFSCAIFPLPALPWVRALMPWNLAGQFVIGVRELIVLGHIGNAGHFALACGVGPLVFLLGLRTLYRLEPRIMERL